MSEIITVRPATHNSSNLAGVAAVAQSMSRPATSSHINTSRNESFFVVALTEGRGVASDVGLAALDLKTSKCVISQFGDNHLFSNTISKIHAFSPVQVSPSETLDFLVRLSHSRFKIVFSASSIDLSTSKLFQVVDQKFTESEIVAVPRTYFNDANGLSYINQLGIQQVELIPGLKSRCYCLSAVSALIKYIENSQNIVFTNNSLKFVFETLAHAVLIDPVTSKNLELVRNLTDHTTKLSLYEILNQTKTSMGSRLLRLNILQPPNNPATIDARLDSIEELLQNMPMLDKVGETLRDLLDVDHLITSLIQFHRKQSLKHAEQAVNRMIVLKHIILQLKPIANALNGCTSDLLVAIKRAVESPIIAEIQKSIDEVIMEEAVYQKTAIGLRNQRIYAVRPGFNGFLDVARQTYKEAIGDVEELVDEYCKKYNLTIKLLFASTSGYYLSLDAEVCAVADLPSEFKNVVKRRKQLHFTTIRLMNQNNRIQESMNEVYLMGDRVISELNVQSRKFLPILYQISESMALLDILYSFACTSRCWICVRPEFTNTLAIKNGRHPVLSKKNNETIPNDTFADSVTRLHIVTGPNASGKTTYLKQIALLTLMGHMGLFVPAEYVSIKLMSHIFSRIGTDESIEAGASTFLREMRETAFILTNVTDRSLIIMDEIGRGTSMSDGLAVCLAICEALLKTKSFTFFVTHFVELAQALNGLANVVNVHLQAIPSDRNVGGFRFSFKLKGGVCSHEAYGIAMAASIIPFPGIIQRAKEIANLLRETRAIAERQNERHKINRQEKFRLQLAGDLIQLMNSNNITEDAVRRCLIDMQSEAKAIIASS